MVRAGRWKYIFDPTDEVDELYDLDADPWELTSLAADQAHAGARARMRDLLLDWSISTEGGRPTPLFFDRETGLNAREGFLP
jgi:arylsulfatase A-like enzyme